MLRGFLVNMVLNVHKMTAVDSSPTCGLMIDYTSGTRKANSTSFEKDPQHEAKVPESGHSDMESALHVSRGSSLQNESFLGRNSPTMSFFK